MSRPPTIPSRRNPGAPMHETLSYPIITVTPETDSCLQPNMASEHILSCGHIINTMMHNEPCAPNCHHVALAKKLTDKTQADLREAKMFTKLPPWFPKSTATKMPPPDSAAASLGLLKPTALVRPRPKTTAAEMPLLQPTTAQQPQQAKMFYCDACVESLNEARIPVEVDSVTANELRCAMRKAEAERRGKETHYRKCYIATIMSSVPVQNSGRFWREYQPREEHHPFDSLPHVGDFFFESMIVDAEEEAEMLRRSVGSGEEGNAGENDGVEGPQRTVKSRRVIASLGEAIWRLFWG